MVAGEGKTIPTLSIIMLAAIYGLQALVFIFRMRWDMIAWMICTWGVVCGSRLVLRPVYILAIPVFSFFLPLYSFWKMDDFSWGSTRLVVGEKGRKIVIHVSPALRAA
jgi:chitin synthase